MIAPAEQGRLPFSPVVHRAGSPLPRLLAFVAVLALWTAAAVPARADQLSDKKAEAQRIASQLDAQSNRLAELAEQFNQARLRADTVAGQERAAAAEVGRIRGQVDQIRSDVREQAVAAYVRGGMAPTAGLDTGDLDPSRLEQYVSSIVGQRQDSLDALRAALQTLDERQAALDAARQKARDALAKVSASRRDASAAQSSQRATLNKVQGELSGLVAAESRRRAEAEARRAQQAMAARQARDATATRAAPARGAPSRGSSPRVVQPSGPPPGPPASGASAAVAKAKEQIGKPYQWGGAGPDSFDCSGLTSYAWRAGGRSLPHSSQAQWNATARVAIASLEPGDLVFYGSPIHHVGIYVGGGQMVEASETGTPIRYASIYRSDLVGAGRVN
jgi:cell wall-associated NlpC family hydrolase